MALGLNDPLQPSHHPMFLQELTILLDRAAEELAGGTVSRRGADLEQSSLSGCGIEESKCRDCEQEEIL